MNAIASSETWLISSNHDAFLISGYNFISNFGTERICDGVGLYLNSGVMYFKHNDFIYFNLCIMSDSIKSLFVEIQQPKNANVIIGCVYRAPNSDIKLYI